MEQHQKLAKYLRGTAKALNQLAKEIEDDGFFEGSSQDLMTKIASNLLFEARAYDYRSK